MNDPPPTPPPTPMQPTRLRWEAVTLARAAEDLAEAQHHLETLRRSDPDAPVDCRIQLDLDPQEPAPRAPTAPR
ncbi:hypothetical protein AB0H73_36210 [Streptomyces olivoreticuli]